ncbi:hypothetical protein EXE55_10560 [Burkholderia glumae]|nr:hypothetical protein Y5A_014375 [Burkholderia glumae AU6208]QHP92542.1 hypothetical protein EXE55_10560 [Burkholderia glumae]
MLCAVTVDVNGVTRLRRTGRQKLFCESLWVRTVCATAYAFLKPLSRQRLPGLSTESRGLC